MGKLAEIKTKPTSSSVEDFINNRRTGVLYAALNQILIPSGK